MFLQKKSQSLQNLILLPRKEDQSLIYFASYVHVAALPALYFEWTLCSINGRGQSYVKHECEMLFIDHHCEMKWDRVMITDRHILASRPDRLLFDKPNKTAELIDIATLRGWSSLRWSVLWHWSWTQGSAWKGVTALWSRLSQQLEWLWALDSMVSQIHCGLVFMLQIRITSW